MKFNLIPSDQIRDPLRIPKQQIGSEQVPQHLPHLASTELEGFFQPFKVHLQPSNELKIILHSNPSSTTPLLDKHSSTVFHNQHRIGIPDEYFVETCINTSTHNGFVTKEFVKIDKDSQTQDYTIIYIKFQGQTPPFSTYNQDIFERLLSSPFPQVGRILSEEEDN